MQNSQVVIVSHPFVPLIDAQARLRELRRTKDPKRKDKYFNSKQLLAGDTTVSNIDVNLLYTSKKSLSK
jgi:hypothetical protein